MEVFPLGDSGDEDPAISSRNISGSVQGCLQEVERMDNPPGLRCKACPCRSSRGLCAITVRECFHDSLFEGWDVLNVATDKAFTLKDNFLLTYAPREVVQVDMVR